MQDDGLIATLVISGCTFAAQSLMTLIFYFKSKMDKDSEKETKAYRELLLEKIKQSNENIHDISDNVKELQKHVNDIPKTYVTLEECARYRQEGKCGARK